MQYKLFSTHPEFLPKKPLKFSGDSTNQMTDQSINVVEIHPDNFGLAGGIDPLYETLNLNKDNINAIVSDPELVLALSAVKDKLLAATSEAFHQQIVRMELESLDGEEFDKKN